jgi:hypothetical protein
VHAISEEENDYSNESFYEELEQAFDLYPKYRMKILLGDLNIQVGIKNIFKPTNGNDRLQQGSKNIVLE